MFFFTNMIYEYFINKKTARLKWLICVFAYAATVVAQPSLQTRLDDLLNDDFFQTATIGVAVYDLTEGKMLYTHNERRLCRPASTMKLLTSAAALSLTPGYSFKTGVYHTGTIDESGRLTGDIYLVGGFDPELRSSDLETLAAAVKKAGINSIDGSLFLDVSMGDSLYWGRAWSWDDDMEAFQPYLSPIPLNKGVARMRVTPTTAGRAPTITIEPESSFIQVINRANTVQRSVEPAQRTLRFSRELIDDANQIEVSGIIAASAAPYNARISLKNPHGYALTVFSEKMAEQFPESNIRIAGTMRLPNDAKNIDYVTRRITDVIRLVNKDSDNLGAEMILYALGYRQSSLPATTEKGIAAVNRMMEQIGFAANTYRMVDGSGLSNQNYLSPEQLVAVLIHMHQSRNFNVFRQSLPVAGVDGTLANRMRNTPAFRKVTAKTGSLTSVSTLSGYVTASNGNLLAFSIMIQNFVERAAFVATNYIDKICVALAE